MTDNFYRNKKVLVTGGTGLLGMAFVELLLQKGANVRVVSLDASDFLPPEVEFFALDLIQWENCLKACEGMDYVFQLACVKGGVGLGESRAVNFLEGNALVNLHMLKAARQCGVKRYQYSSSIAVYPDTEIFKEDEVWNKPPHPSNKYASWGKRIGELQCEAYLEQYGFKTSLVRPANIYGPFDNFDQASAMVVPALIARVCSGEDPLKVWGDGNQVRDFLYVKDCVRGMMEAMEKYYECDPLNIGSGVATTIREIVETILKYAPRKPKVVWDTSRPIGNRIRLMDMTKTGAKLGFGPEYSLDEGIKETLDWYLAHKDFQTKKVSLLA